MERGAVADLPVAISLVEGLPSVFRSDEFTVRYVEAFDSVLAPVFQTLDCIDSYFDPLLAPDDFLPCLASWVGIALSERLTDAQRRHLIDSAVELYLWRGTRRGIERAIEVYFGIDSGAVSWSPQPNGPAPGEAPPSLLVRVSLDNATATDIELIERIVSEAKPAHIPHRVEVTGPTGRRRRAAS
jgi:phage tail-like protein